MDENRWTAIAADAEYALRQLEWVGRRSRSAPDDVTAALGRTRDTLARIEALARAELAALRTGYQVPAGWDHL